MESGIDILEIFVKFLQRLCDWYFYISFLFPLNNEYENSVQAKKFHVIAPTAPREVSRYQITHETSSGSFMKLPEKVSMKLPEKVSLETSLLYP